MGLADRIGGGAAVVLLAVGLAACGGGSSGPAGPPGPDLSTPEGTLLALEDFYSRRMAEEAIALLSPEYRFFPAQPESIPFLAPGEAFWDYEVEKSILSRLLVPERTSWIDQVLLEISRRGKQARPDGRVEIDADVELSLLVGTDQFEKGRSRTVLILEADAGGDYRVVEEHEALALDENGRPLTTLTVGRRKAAVLSGP